MLSLLIFNNIRKNYYIDVARPYLDWKRVIICDSLQMCLASQAVGPPTLSTLCFLRLKNNREYHPPHPFNAKDDNS